MPRRVALATCADWPDLTPDDRLLVPALAEAGIAAEPVRWDAGRQGWDGLDGVVIRSTWDYPPRLAAFLDWADAVERAGLPLWNPSPVVRWNADKRYLLDLAQRSVPVVPTRVLQRIPASPGPTGPRLAEVLAAEGWTDAVVKPAVSGGGRDTWRVQLRGHAETQDDPDLPEADEHAFAALRSKTDVLVQPFASEVLAAGEWSLMFLDGAFSHAVHKRTGRPGEFRVQEDLGGIVEARPPPRGAVAQAEAALEASLAAAGASGQEAPLFARIDGVMRGATFQLMETELIEPSLWFALAPKAAPARFAGGLRARLRR